MDYSVREAKAHFAAAINAAANGERVVVTKHGVPFVEIIPARPIADEEDIWAKFARIRKELGINPDNFDLDEEWMARFNDPALSRRLLGMED